MYTFACCLFSATASPTNTWCASCRLHTHLSTHPCHPHASRYAISDDEAAAEAEGQLARHSQGADLEQLLAESEQFYAQAHFRYRRLLDTDNTEPPPVDVAALEQV
jgi:hypothetical protein